MLAKKKFKKVNYICHVQLNTLYFNHLVHSSPGILSLVTTLPSRRYGPGGQSCSFLKGDLLPSVLRTTSYQFAVSSRRPNSFRILDHRIGNPNCGVNSDNVWNRTSFVVLFFSNYFFCLTTDQKKRSGDVTKQSPVDAEKFLSLYQTIFS